MQPHVIRELGYLAETELAQDIGNGNFEAPDTWDTYLNNLLHHLELPEVTREH